MAAAHVILRMNLNKYNKIIEQHNYFELNGFNLCQVWECEWNGSQKILHNKKELEHDAKQQNINIRDALFGDPTEGFKAYYKCDAIEKIFDFDMCSLYSTVNALDAYPIGYGRYARITTNDIISDKFFGFVNCDVIPPNDLLIPVLPDNTDGKLLFDVTPKYNKTFASIEVKLALQLGYKINIHSFSISKIYQINEQLC